MSKKWTVISVVVGILALCLVGAAGFVTGRASSFAAMRRAGVTMPNPRGFDLPGRVEGRDRGDPNSAAPPRQLEVTLIDDDDDGIPDRGVVELPARADVNCRAEDHFNDRFGPPQNFGPDFNPTRSPFNLLPFFPLGPVAGLVCLTILAGLGIFGVVRYRRRSSTPTVSVTPPPVGDPPEVVEADDSEVPPAETEADAPKDVEPTPEPSDETPDSDDDESTPEEKPSDS